MTLEEYQLGLALSNIFGKGETVLRLMLIITCFSNDCVVIMVLRTGTERCDCAFFNMVALVYVVDEVEGALNPIDIAPHVR